MEASTSEEASSSGANLGPDSSSAPALDVIHTLEALDAAGGGLANDDIEQLAADPALSVSPWPAQAPADASASGSDPPPGLQSYDPAASGGHDQSASLGPADDGADPWAGIGAQRSLGKLTWAPLLRPSLRELHQRPLRRLTRPSTLRVSHFGCAPAGQGGGLPLLLVGSLQLIQLWACRVACSDCSQAHCVRTFQQRSTCAAAASASAVPRLRRPRLAADPTTSTSASAQAEQPSNQPDTQPSDSTWADGSWTSSSGNWWGGRGW